MNPCDTPCPKCGGMDIYRNFYARDHEIESEFHDKAPFPKYVAKGLGYKEWFATREFISNACRTCHFMWQLLPLKKTKSPRQGENPAAQQ